MECTRTQKRSDLIRNFRCGDHLNWIVVEDQFPLSDCHDVCRVAQEIKNGDYMVVGRKFEFEDVRERIITFDGIVIDRLRRFDAYYDAPERRSKAV